MKPKLQLKIDIKADIRNAKWFVGYGKFVDWFLPDELQYIIEKKMSKTEKNKIIKEYSERIFAEKREEIESGVKLTEKKWRNVENNFYDFVSQLFQGHPWPKGKYIGYVSIFSMFPRDVQHMTFFFSYDATRWNPLRIIGHEMLHFIFFDYIKNKYGIDEKDKLEGKDPEYVWQVSESFNTVIENWKPYSDIFSINETAKPYPECEKMFIKMTKHWEQDQDIKKLLDRYF